MSTVLTMVMRCGEVKMSNEAINYTLIAEDYSIKRMTGFEIIKGIMNNEIEVTNMGVKDNTLVSTNGAIKNYTMVNTNGVIVNTPRAVILNRIETDKGLIGYTIYNMNGVLQEINVAQAVQLAQGSMVANGKIRHTQNGDIVASIGGLYPLRVIKVAEAKDTKIKTDLMFVGSALTGKSITKYAGLMVNGNSAASITKVYDILVKSNKKLINSIVESTGDTTASETLGIKRTGTAGFYGVYPIETVFELIGKAGNKVGVPMGKIMIACTDYDADKEEANLVITPDLKITDHQTGSAKANKAIKEYAEKIITKLKGIEIQK